MTQSSRAARNVAALLLSTTMLAGAAVAQETAPLAGQITDADKTADAATQDTGEVTVYARKRAENVQLVPIPVTVIGAEALTRQNLVNFTNFQNKFPAFSVFLTNPKQQNLGIRGLGNNGFNTDGIDGSVGIFVDGVYTGRQGMVSSDFNDLAQVELLRGPQGTLFGKNTTAGAVLINTLKPSFQTAATVEGSFGNFGFGQAKAGVTGPLIADKLAARLSVYYSDIDGTYPNVYRAGSPAQNERQGQGVRAQLLATPTDTLQIRLIGTYNHQAFRTLSPVILSIFNPAALQARMAANGFTLLTGNIRDRQLNIDGRQDATTDLHGATGIVDWEAGGGGTVTAITGYQHWKCHTNNDNDYTQLNAIPDYGSCNDEHQFSQEVRWASQKDQPIEATLGGFLSRQKLDVDSRIRFGNQYYIWATNPSATAFPTRAGRTWAQGAYANDVAGLGFRSDATFHTDTEAVFGNVSWHPDDARRLGIDGGLRYTWERRSQLYTGVVASNLGNLTTAQINALSPSGANAQLGSVDLAIKDHSLSGEASVDYRFTRDVFGYVKFARGYKSKGFNLLPENSSNPDPSIAQAVMLGATQAIKGESADNIEAGLKTQWFDRHLILNITAFHTKVKNYQANQSVGVGNTAFRFLSNVGSVTTKGVELEGEAWPAPGLHLKGFVAYDRAYYSSFPNSTCPAQVTTLSCDLTGRQVAWAPKWTADLTTDLSAPIGGDRTVYALIDVNWRTKQNTTINLDPSAEIKGYALVSYRTGVRFGGRFELQSWIENLANKRYYINLIGLTRSTGVVQGYPGNPRTYGVTLRGNF